MSTKRRNLSTDDYVEGILAQDVSILGRAISLVESNNAEHRQVAQEVLRRIMDRSGKAIRLGVTGSPGVGKSTFIESLGTHLIEAKNHRVAVLAVDPSSSRRGGSILGDKTRMERLAALPTAFIRPSPSKGSLGGVHRKTRESMLICEAAGYDVILVETVGVGQSETEVADMVDTYLVLLLAGAGDELQGIKKGILEVADMLAINKADGDNRELADRARRDFKNALHLFTPRDAAWHPPVLTCSALESSGIERVWEKVLEHRDLMMETGEFDRRRASQNHSWLWSLIEHELLERFKADPKVQSRLKALLPEVSQGRVNPTEAATTLLNLFHGDPS